MAVKKTTSVLKETLWPWLVPVSVCFVLFFHLTDPLVKKYLLFLVKTNVESWSNVLIKQLTDPTFCPLHDAFFPTHDGLLHQTF